MGREEQVEEREVLDAIFPDEITDIDDTHFRIAVALDVARQDDEDEEKPIIVLDVTFPEKYPDVAPHLDLSNPHDGPRHPDLDLAADKAALLAAVEPMIADSLGMAMVFNVVTTLKEAAEQLIDERAQAADAVREAELRAAEEKEDAKFHGERVTRERFLAWRETFREEMAGEAKRQADEAEALAMKKGGKSAVAVLHGGGKLTGREMWERGLAKAVEEDEDDDGNTAVAEATDAKEAEKGVAALKVKG